MLHNFGRWITCNNHLAKIILIVYIIGIPLLVFYNLGINPRPWHDEGAALLVARTFVEDGIYAMRNSDGYQTFGPIQSIGPTIILPVALCFKWFGVGLIQGRFIAAIYTLIALFFFYLIGKFLFDSWTAIISIFFLLSAPAVRFLIYGREVLGEVPALAIFLGGWLSLAWGLKKQKVGYRLLAGLLFGATIITKSQYLIILTASLGLMIILDITYYRQSAWKSLAAILVIAGMCVVFWHAWQVHYFGRQEYQTNLENLRQLASGTLGLHSQTIISGIRSILGSDSGHFYLFWGFPALGYVIYQAIERNQKGLLYASLAIFTTLWLLYFVFWIVPWHHYALPAMTLLALFIGHLFTDLLRNIIPYITKLKNNWNSQKSLSSTGMLVFGCMIALFSYTLWAGYNLQNYIRSDVLDKTGLYNSDFRSPPQLQYPWMLAEFLTNQIPPNSIIETWERELGIITDLTYHFPDQTYLAKTHNAIYRGAPVDYLLGQDYFRQVQADYVIIGWFERSFPIYDHDYLEENCELIYKVGEGNYNYEVYQFVDNTGP